MKVIFNSDDFGLAYSFSEGARYCYLKGVLRSVSIRVNGPAYDYASSLLKNELKKIGRGVHLNLTDGMRNVGFLTNEKGFYKNNFSRLWYLLLKGNKKLLSAIRYDLEMQIRKAYDDGLNPDHVDSEKHVHMIPPIFEIVCQLCREYKIKYIRLVREPYFLLDSFTANAGPYLNMALVKFLILNKFANENILTLEKYNLATTDSFYGILHTNNMTEEMLMKIITDAKKRRMGSVEICSHPGFPSDKRDIVYTSSEIKTYANLNNRIVEAKALNSRILLNFLMKNKIELISFRDLD